MAITWNPLTEEQRRSFTDSKGITYYVSQKEGARGADARQYTPEGTGYYMRPVFNKPPEYWKAEALAALENGNLREAVRYWGKAGSGTTGLSEWVKNLSGLDVTDDWLNRAYNARLSGDTSSAPETIAGLEDFYDRSKFDAPTPAVLPYWADFNDPRGNVVPDDWAYKTTLGIPEDAKDIRVDGTSVRYTDSRGFTRSQQLPGAKTRYGHDIDIANRKYGIFDPESAWMGFYRDQMDENGYGLYEYDRDNKVIYKRENGGRGSVVDLTANLRKGGLMTTPTAPVTAPVTTTPTTASTTSTPTTAPVTTTPTMMTNKPMIGSPDVAASGPAAGPGSYGGMMTPWAAKGFSYSGFGGGGGSQGSGMPRRRGLFYR